MASTVPWTPITFEQFHGRAALVDKLRDLLYIGEARPSAAHKAFAKVPFDVVLTSNIDFLLEESWNATGRPFDPVIGEQWLALRRRATATQLIKFHGDVHHLNELVVTENDYDGFLSRFPLLSTYVASLLISRVPVLFGYSAEDPDFRALLSLLTDRLGRNHSVPWVILARGNPAQIARYERRGVKVVVLSRGRSSDHGYVFEAFFNQLADALPRAAASRAEATDDGLLSDLRFGGASRSLVVFLGARERLAQYRDFVFPHIRRAGYKPITRDDVVSPPHLQLASLTQLLSRAAGVVVDDRGWNDDAEKELVYSTVSPERLMVVADADERPHYPPREQPGAVVGVNGNDLATVALELVALITDLAATESEPSREVAILSRLETGDYSAAFIEAVVAVETQLRRRSDLARSPFQRLLELDPSLTELDGRVLREAYKYRSEYLHQGVVLPADTAHQLTLELLRILRTMEAEEPSS
jgi:hypothetical protein